MIATSLAGCGEVSVSYKGIRSPISSSRSSKSSKSYSSSKSISTSVGDYVSPYVAYSYDETYYQPDYNSYSTEYVQQFLYRNSIDTDGAPIYNVTPRSISNRDDGVHILNVHGSNVSFLFIPRLNETYILTYNEDNQIMQMGFNDYDSNGVEDIVIWSINKETSEYIIDIVDATDKEMFNVVNLHFQHPNDLLFFIYESGFYVNQKKVYYVNGQFYCTGVFDYVYPTNIY